MAKLLTRAKLGFRNASVQTQIVTAGGLASGIQSLPPEKQTRLQLEKLQGALAEAVLVQKLLAKYRSKVKELLTRQKRVMPRLRMAARISASGVESLATVSGPSVIPAVGLPLEKSKRTRTGVPPAPTFLRAKVRAGAILL